MSFKKISEYINTDDGTAGTLLIPKLILEPLVQEVEKALIPREMAAKVVMGFPGATFDYNLISPNTMDVLEVGEGAEIPLDNIGFTNVTFTPKKYGVAIRITREMMEDSQFAILQENIKYAGKRFAEKETELILTALDSAGTTVTGGAAITIANITEGMMGIENNDYIPTDILFGSEVLNDLRNIDTFVEANKVGNRDMIDRGFLGTIFGLNCARYSTNAAPSTTYAKYAYIIDRSQAYGIAIKRDITVENFSLPTYDMDGAAITWRFDVQLLRANAVAKITTA